MARCKSRARASPEDVSASIECHWRLGYPPSVFHQSETVGEAFDVARLHAAQRETWSVLSRLAQQVRPGMITADVKRMLRELTVGQKHWHPGQLRLGQNTLCYFNQPALTDEPLKDSDVFFIDIGLVVDGYEGDCGRTFVLGSDPEHLRCAADAERVHQEGVQHWLQTQCSGRKLYEFTRARAEARGWMLSEQKADGHRIGDFPHSRFSRAHLIACDFSVAPDRWIYEVHLVDPNRRFGAFYEDLLSPFAAHKSSADVLP